MAEVHRTRAQRRGSRRKQGSQRRKQAVHLLRRVHQLVQRQRRAFHPKTALTLVRQDATLYATLYATLSPEDLPPAHLLRTPARAQRSGQAQQ